MQIDKVLIYCSEIEKQARCLLTAFGGYFIKLVRQY